MEKQYCYSQVGLYFHGFTSDRWHTGYETYAIVRSRQPVGDADTRSSPRRQELFFELRFIEFLVASLET